MVELESRMMAKAILMECRDKGHLYIHMKAQVILHIIAHTHVAAGLVNISVYYDFKSLPLFHKF